MNPLADTLESVHSSLRAAVRDAFDTHALEGLTDDALLEVMATAAGVIRQAEAVLVAATGQVHDRSESPASDARLTTRLGCRSVSELIQRATLSSRTTVANYERAARGVAEDTAPSTGERLPAEYPALRAALIDGAIGVDGLVAVLTPLASIAGRAGRDAHLAADEELAASARGEGVDAAPPACAEDLRALAHVWAVYLDPDGAEPREAVALRKRGLTLGTGRDGLIPIRGHLLPEVAAQLQRIFDSLLNPKLDGPRFTPTRPGDAYGDAVGTLGGSTDAGARLGAGVSTANGVGERGDDIDAVAPVGAAGPDAYGDGTGEPGGGDDDTGGVLRDQSDMRTRVQKQHDALATALTIAARAGELPTIGGAAPTLVVAVRAENLVAGRGYAHTDGTDEPVSIGVARHTACDGVVQRVISDSTGRITGIHILDRVFNHHQRKAITLRDGGCIIPGCQVPAGWCEIHHVTDHAHGGPTHTDNGVLLCWHHHRTLASNGWQIRMHHGVPHVRGPHWWDPHQHWRPTTTSPTRMNERLIRRRQ